MIFTQADKERLERIEHSLVTLSLDVGLRDQAPSPRRELAIHDKINLLTGMLNELGVALGRIESAQHNLDGIDQRNTDIANVLSATVNRRADEALDTMRGLKAGVAELVKEKEDRTKWVDNQLATLEDQLAHIEKIFVAALVRRKKK